MLESGVDYLICAEFARQRLESSNMRCQGGVKDFTLTRVVACRVQGYLARKKTPTTLGPPEGPRHGSTVGSQGARFLMREVPL